MQQRRPESNGLSNNPFIVFTTLGCVIIGTLLAVVAFFGDGSSKPPGAQPTPTPTIGNQPMPNVEGKAKAKSNVVTGVEYMRIDPAFDSAYPSLSEGPGKAKLDLWMVKVEIVADRTIVHMASRIHFDENKYTTGNILLPGNRMNAYYMLDEDGSRYGAIIPGGFFSRNKLNSYQIVAGQIYPFEINVEKLKRRVSQVALEYTGFPRITADLQWEK